LETEKKEFIEYLDGVLYNLRPNFIRMPSNLAKIKKDLSLEFDYQTELKNAGTKQELEDRRAKSIKAICEKISTTGGSDTDLVERTKKINTNFFQKIVQEIEKAGINLETTEKDWLTKPPESELEKASFARELVKKKKTILWKNNSGSLDFNKNINYTTMTNYKFLALPKEKRLSKGGDGTTPLNAFYHSLYVHNL